MARHSSCLVALTSLLGSIAIATLSGAALANEVSLFPSNESLRHFRSVDDPRLSPDGARVLLKITDPTAEGGESHLWLLSLHGEAPRQLTFSAEADRFGESAGEWAPDGQSILFLAHRGDHVRLFQLPLNGGEAQALKLTSGLGDASSHTTETPAPLAMDSHEELQDLPADIVAYSLSPDGKWIAFIARDTDTPAEKRLKVIRSDAQWVDHDPHGKQLGLFNRETQQATLVPLPMDVEDVSWNRTGSELIAIVEGARHAGDLAPARSAWVVTPLDSQNSKRIDELPATVQTAMWSADGRTIVYLAQSELDAPPTTSDLYFFDLPSRATRNASRDLDGSIGGNPIELKDRGIALIVTRGVENAVAIYLANGRDPSFVSLPVSSVSSFSTNARQEGWLFLGSSAGSPVELYYARRLTDHARKLKTPMLTPELIRSVSARRIQWNNEGLTIEGLLYLPPAAAHERVPLVVQAHGGPPAAYVDAYDPFVDFLVSQGWAVLRANPRGSAGHGAAFAAANKNDLGGADYRDIMAGVDYVLGSEPLDPQRMALIGYSYGGELAAFVEVKTTRFKAIISGAPIIDQYSEYGTEECAASASWFDRWYFGKPWEHVADAWRQSPLSGVASAKTPMLLLQGSDDVCSPPGQSEEMYRALRQTGVPVDLVIYPRENHLSLEAAIDGNPSREPWHGFDARGRLVSFIERAFTARQ